jgi:hypothetical protein
MIRPFPTAFTANGHKNHCRRAFSLFDLFAKTEWDEELRELAFRKMERK